MKNTRVDLITLIPQFGNDFGPEFTPRARRTDFYSIGFQFMERGRLCRVAVRIGHKDSPRTVAIALRKLAATLEDSEHKGARWNNEILGGHEINAPKKGAK